MVGITRYASYIPVHRLERRLIEQAWGTRQAKGEVAVANYDEDALTLAAEAAMGCLGDPSVAVDGVYFASVSAPYGEKQLASVLATVCDLPRALFTADFAGSTRAGVSATLAALRAVQAGAAHTVLVAAADVRVAAPESELEGVLGDAAAALAIGDRDVIAEFVDAASIADEFTHFWRTDAQRTVQVTGGRFGSDFGYGKDVGVAIRTILERQQLEPKAIHRLALASPDARASADLAKSLGFDPKTQLVASLQGEIGSTGSAEPLLLLARALDDAAPGDLILVGGYGEGADALLFRATAALPSARAAVPLARWLAAKTTLPSYQRYLKFRRLVEVEEVSDVVTSALEYKERKQNIRLYGSKCLACGQLQYPMARVCIRCRAQEQMEDARVTRRGEVFTFTVDHLIANLEHPLPMAVIDADGGARLYLQIADADDIQIGARVTFTYRRLHEGGGNRNYYWKARPVREAGR
ncbi:MAG: 3-oxoacyl-[acyl-carrier-protein] synthase III C-terminal domain-containing protein [bacterium]